MSKLFKQVRMSRPGRNAFDLSHERKLSCNMGELVPILVQPIIPGDRMKNVTEALVRLAPMTAPVMHRINVHTHFFFVPNRLLYSNWETFITGGEDGKQVPTFPTITFNGAVSMSGYLSPGQLPDHMGIPTIGTENLTRDLTVSALPFRAYQMIYNEYYRDQNLTGKVVVTKNDTVASDELTSLLTMRRRAWEKDYFTSALPWTQRGDEVELPTKIDYKDYAHIYNQGPGQTEITDGGAVSTVKAGTPGNPGALSDGNDTLKIENIESLGTTINDLRRAVRLQEWLEKNARAGSRYIEQILSHFGVASSDARLQRPEYLGGAKNPVVISEVLSTFNNETVPGANMYGHGVSAGSGFSFNKSFEEHGYIIGILSVLPRTAYYQGVPKDYLKTDKFDFFWPEFAQLGEQPVQRQEVFKAWDTPNEDQVFGYQSRYAEYKFQNSSIHGDFRKTLNYWHMAREFASPGPDLNTSFVEANPTHRIFANTTDTDHKLYIQLFNNLKALRPMPTFNTPTL